jgi:hypothetical protein
LEQDDSTYAEQIAQEELPLAGLVRFGDDALMERPNAAVKPRSSLVAHSRSMENFTGEGEGGFTEQRG